MPQLTYQDFDLLIDRDGDAYRARVVASPGGQSAVSTRFTLPFSDLELENFLLKVGGRKRGVRGGGRVQSGWITDWGGALFATVFTDEVRGCLDRSLAAVEDGGLRIRLRLSDCPELADLPWEYLYDPARRRFLCLSERTPLVRYLPLPDPVRPLTVEGPVRILAVISNPDLDQPPLDVATEWANLRQALTEPVAAGRIAVDRLAHPTMPELHRALGRDEYHILHFIGHGRFNTADKRGELLFEDERGQEHAVAAETLAAILHDHRSLRLAVLNACEGARAGSADPFAGTAQTLIQQGIPAVVAMQFEISDPAAIAFSEGFYDAIARERPLDSATATGRARIYATNPVEWATPVLYTRAADTAIFRGGEVRRVQSASAPAPGGAFVPLVAPIAVAPQTAAPIADPAGTIAPATAGPGTPAARAAESFAPPVRPHLSAPAVEHVPAAPESITVSDPLPAETVALPVIVPNPAATSPVWGPAAASPPTPTASAPSPSFWTPPPLATPPPIPALHRAVPPRPFRAGRMVVWDAGGSSDPVPTGLPEVVAVSGGTRHKVALHPDGRVTSWGNYLVMKAGTPPGLSDVVAISANAAHSLFLRANGTITAAGSYGYKKVVVPSGLPPAVAISAGALHSLVLHVDGRITAFGNNVLGQCIVPQEANEAVAVAAGMNFSVALRRDGTVVTWGNTAGLGPMPPGLQNITAIAAGSYHVVVLSRDGRVMSWGNPSKGAQIPPTITDAVAIACGESHAIVQHADGRVSAWGPAGRSFIVPAWLNRVITIGAAEKECMAIVEH